MAGKLSEPAPPLPQQTGPSFPRRQMHVRWLLAIGLAAAIIAFYALGGHRFLTWETVQAHFAEWKLWTNQNPLASVAIFFIVYTTVTALSLPVATVLSLLAGALFGLVLGFAVVSVSSTLGATLAFLSSRYLF